MSCYGRLHPESANVLERIAGQAARRLGVRDQRPLLRRARAALGVALCCRAAAMARACLPKLSQESVALLLGARDEEEGEGEVRLPLVPAAGVVPESLPAGAGTPSPPAAAPPAAAIAAA